MTVEKQQPVALVPYWFVQRDPSSASTLSTERTSTKADIQSAAVLRIEPASVASRSQLMPNSPINDEQVTNRIFNQHISTSLTPSSTLVTRTSRITDNRSNQDVCSSADVH